MNVNEYVAAHNGDRGFEPELDASLPSDAPPGSSEKIHVMRQRVERGEQVFHVHDKDFRQYDWREDCISDFLRK